MTLTEFLTARLDEDEAAAKAAGGFLDSGGPAELAVDMRSFQWRGAALAEASIVHIARHIPARVLREVEAKRKRLSFLAEAQANFDKEMAAPQAVDASRAVASGILAAARRAVLFDAAVYIDNPEWKLKMI